MFFDLSWSHILLLLVVTLVVVGPQDLPKIMRKAGQWTAKARAMADQFRNSFDEMARQSELDELRKEIESLRNTRPLAETEKALNDAIKIPEISLSPAAPAAAATSATTATGAVAETGAPEGVSAEVPLAEPAAPDAAPVGASEESLPQSFTPPAGEPVAVSEPVKPIEGGITPPAP